MHDCAVPTPSYTCETHPIAGDIRIAALLLLEFPESIGYAGLIRHSRAARLCRPSHGLCAGVAVDTCLRECRTIEPTFRRNGKYWIHVVARRNSISWTYGRIPERADILMSCFPRSRDGSGFGLPELMVRLERLFALRIGEKRQRAHLPAPRNAVESVARPSTSALTNHVRLNRFHNPSA